MISLLEGLKLASKTQLKYITDFSTTYVTEHRLVVPVIRPSTGAVAVVEGNGVTSISGFVGS